MTEIESKALTTCEITADGAAISLGFVDGEGRPSAIQFPVDQVGALAMTLPTLIEKALRQRFRDDSLRYTYPLESWSFERSTDPSTGIVTLRTSDGFGVCFSMPRQQQSELGAALSAPPPVIVPPLAN